MLVAGKRAADKNVDSRPEPVVDPTEAEVEEVEAQVREQRVYEK